MALNVGSTKTPPAGGSPTSAPTAAIPFVRAARRKSQVATQVGPITLGASSNQPIQPIQVPAAGYLRYLELLVTVTSTGNSATVALPSVTDAPFNLFNQISLVNSAGDNIITPVSGYALYLFNKYGAQAGNNNDSNPLKLNSYSALTTGSGGTAGSGSFSLFIPLEIDESQAFCSVPNLAANKAYQLQIQLASVANIWTGGTAPNGTVTFNMTVINHYWSQPNPTNAVGVAQEIAPPGAGSVSLYQLETAAVTPGDRLIQSHNVGNVLRYMIFDLRTSAGVRTEADLPATWQIILNNDNLFYYTASSIRDQINQDFGLTGAASGAPSATAGDQGVLVLSDWMSLSATQNGPSHARDQYLPTLDATLLQTRWTNFGATANTLSMYTNAIKPTSAAALYMPHVQ